MGFRAPIHCYLGLLGSVQEPVLPKTAGLILLENVGEKCMLKNFHQPAAPKPP